ncbi:phosphatidylserine decarboxylase, partial [bacterium]|nr:phosphatidylserine decarboxylase [bacterium]
MHREGLAIVIGMFFSTAVVTAGAIYTSQSGLQVLSVVTVLLFLLTVYFFRDPERTIPEGSDIVLSPADGKVVEIKEETENEFLKAVATRVSIFLSVFDVHVNRVPIGGTVEHFRYQRGSFVNAQKSLASDVNEQTVIGIQNETNRVLFKQIAGLLARRIVCDIRQGNRVKKGERFGI